MALNKVVLCIIANIVISTFFSRRVVIAVFALAVARDILTSGRVV